jgi:catechol 2,3-dioxygenase-like lactoylglutathione lyase family enzyme
MRAPAFTGINHVGVVTGDLDRALRTWTESFGIGPWSVHTFDETNMSIEVDGEAVPTAARFAHAFVGETCRIELIEPLRDDDGPYARSLREHGGADHLHHVRLEVADFGAVLGAAARDGVGTVLDAVFADAGGGEPLRVAYLDTGPRIGFITEIVEFPDAFELAPPERYPGAPYQTNGG